LVVLKIKIILAMHRHMNITILHPWGGKKKDQVKLWCSTFQSLPL